MIHRTLQRAEITAQTVIFVVFTIDSIRGEFEKMFSAKAWNRANRQPQGL